jgi:hypothetical protein
LPLLLAPVPAAVLPVSPALELASSSSPAFFPGENATTSIEALRLLMAAGSADGIVFGTGCGGLELGALIGITTVNGALAWW